MRFTLAWFVLLAGCTTNPAVPTCVPSCAGGFHCESGACVPDGSSVDAAADSSAGGCAPACGGVTPFCNAFRHCVACLVDGDCPLGTICKTASEAFSSCVRGCSGDDRCHPDGGAGASQCCGGGCVDTTSDPFHCGGCGKPCSAVHAQASCNNSACATGACDPGYGDCNGDAKDGCEANLHVDAANCTACGMGCALPNASPACSDGCYISACKFGFDDCNGDVNDGCEAPVLTDTANCGSCGAPCAGLPNASANCTDGNCVLGDCNQGFFDCNAVANDGCEVNVATDATNCGKCGNKCPNNLVCKNGGCTCPMCNFPNAASSCVNNVCIMGACVAGFADCNNSPNDGCEVNLKGDPKNCNGCGKACPNNTPFCSMGVCVVAPTLVGSYNVSDGPQWTDNPPCYTCQEACAMVFGGNAASYSCSVVANMVTHTAWESGYADGAHCDMNPFAEDYKLGDTYDCGNFGCSYSAYVSDNCGNSTNYCFQ